MDPEMKTPEGMSLSTDFTATFRSLTVFKELARLARIRENQRKSRARKEEYVRELEQRLAAIQQESRQQDIDNRIALQKWEVENHLIKDLLVSLGFSVTLVKRYLQSAEQNTVTDRKVAIPAVMKRPEETCSAVACQSPCATSSQTSGVPTEEKDLVKQASLNRSVRPVSTIPTQGSAEAQRTVSTSCKKSTTDGLTSEPRPYDPNAFNTTQCVVAEAFLNKHNVQGIDMDEIRHRICPGVKETDIGCCRVQNDVVFQILDEISGEKSL